MENKLDFYRLSKDEQTDFLEERKKRIATGDNELFKNMEKIATKKVENYISDFYVHDVDLLETLRLDTFLWFVRKNGTYVVSLQDNSLLDNGEWSSAAFAKAIRKQCQVSAVYLYADEKLKKINISKLDEVLKQYESLVQEGKKQYA